MKIINRKSVINGLLLFISRWVTKAVSEDLRDLFVIQSRLENLVILTI